MSKKQSLLTILAVCFGLALSLAAAAAEDSPIKAQSLDRLAKAAGIRTSNIPTAKVKVAILDNGFRGFEPARGKTIPVAARLRAAPIAGDEKTEDVHGLKMAEIVSGLLRRAEIPYELQLFPARGYTNFKTAVDTVVAEKFDVVLYAQVWDDGGNGDGKGFINTIVDRAVSTGVLWINSSGNFGQHTYTAPVEPGSDHWLVLPAATRTTAGFNAVELRCHRNESGSCHLRVVLSWNSFPNDTATGTDKDLDLILLDSSFKEILPEESKQWNKQVQTLNPPTASARPGKRSFYPRETIEVDVKPGTYWIRAEQRSKNFAASDRLRINVSGDFVELINHIDGETLLPPADNPGVIVVGASDSEKTAVSRKYNRPDIQIASEIETENGVLLRGSSNSAAAIAARVALELSQQRTATGVAKVSRAAMLGLIAGSESTKPSRQPVMHAQPAGSCYVLATHSSPNAEVRRFLREGGTAAQTPYGLKFFIHEDPFARMARLQIAAGVLTRERLFASADGFSSVEPEDGIEVIQIAHGSIRFCRF